MWKDLPYLAKVAESCNTNPPQVAGSKDASYYRIQRGADPEWNLAFAIVGPLAFISRNHLEAAKVEFETKKMSLG